MLCNNNNAINDNAMNNNNAINFYSKMLKLELFCYCTEQLQNCLQNLILKTSNLI